MGGGKGGTSTTQNFSSGSSSTTIPQDVLNRYNAVNQRAEQAASQPFQYYGGEFVAPVNETQQGGINTITGAANSWNPYFTSAQGQLNQGFGAAYPALQQGLTTGTGLGNASVNATNMALAGSSPYNTQAGNYFTQGLGAASPYNAAAGSAISGGMGGASPYNAAAAGLALAGTGAVNPTALDSTAIGNYMNPYMSQVVDPVVAQMQNVFGQQQRDLSGNQILNGTFGSDRGGIGKATLANQQNLALGQTVSGLYNQNYAQALAAAQQQQGVGLGAAQANRAALQQGAGQLLGVGNQVFGQGVQGGQALQGLGQNIYGQLTGTGTATQGLGNQIYTQGLGAAGQYLNAGNTLFGMGNTAAGTYGNLGVAGSGAYSGLGTANLQNALAQGQAQLGAGTVYQQTQQAQDTAYYNQFLQAQGYPFQVAQFLAGIAEGTGALSGSTTTSSGTSGGSQFAPQPFFSDERLKEDVEVIGKTTGGLNIIKFRYKGSPQFQIGLSAQDVLDKRPEAVGKAEGFYTVDYDAATRRRRAAGGGLMPQGYDQGGTPDAGDMSALLQLHQAMYPGALNARGIGTGPRGMQLAPAGGNRMIEGPKVNLPDVKYAKTPDQTGLGSAIKGAADLSGDISTISKGVGAAKDAIVGSAGDAKNPATGGLLGHGGHFGGGWLQNQINGTGTSPGPSTSPPGSITTSPNPPPADSSSPPSGEKWDAKSPTGTSADTSAPPADSAPPPAADAPPPQVSGLDVSPNVSDSSTLLASADAPSDLGDLSDLSDLFAARGGRMKRAAGGADLPYASSYVPDDSTPDPSALVNEQKGMVVKDPNAEANAAASKSSGSGSSGGGIGDALKTAASIASLVALFNRGGRVERKLGGLAGMASGSTRPPIVDLISGDTGDLADDTLGSMGLDGFAGGLIPFQRGGGARGGFAGGGGADEVNPPAVDPAADVQAEARREQTLNPAAAAGLGAARQPATPAPTPASAPSQNAPTASVAPANTGQATGPTDDQIGRTVKRGRGVIAHIESGTGDDERGYDTVSPRNSNGTYDIGKFQVNDTNVPAWTKQWYGQALTPDEFRKNPQAQEAVYAGQMGKYVRDLGSFEKAAMAWQLPGAVYNNDINPALAWRGSRAAALYEGKPDPGPYKGGGVGGGVGGVTTPPADVNAALRLANTNPNLVQAGGQGPSGQFDPLTGRTPRDHNAGFFDKGGWLDANQKEVMSGLAFLGGMLSSPSHTLAGSVGSGLVTGAGTYLGQANKEQGLGQAQQQIGQEQQRIGIARVNQLLQAYQNALKMQQAYAIGHNGQNSPEIQKQMDLIMQQIQEAGGFATRPPGMPGAPGAGAPAAAPSPGGGIPAPGSGAGAPVTQNTPPPPVHAPTAPPAATTPPPAATTPPAQTTTAPAKEPTVEEVAHKYGVPQPGKDFYDKLGADNVNNPQYWHKKAEDASALGLPIETINQYKQAEANAIEKIKHDGYALDQNNNRVEYGPPDAVLQKRAADNQAYLDQGAALQDQRREAINRFQIIGQILQKYQPNRLADVWSEVNSLATALNLQPPSDTAASVQEFIKQAEATILSQAGAERDHNTEGLRAHIKSMTPGPTLDPGPNRQIVAQALGWLQDRQLMYEETQRAIAAEPRLNLGPFQTEMQKQKQHDITARQNSLEDEMPVRGDVPKDMSKAKVGRVYMLSPADMFNFQNKEKLEKQGKKVAPIEEVARRMGETSMNPSNWGVHKYRLMPGGRWEKVP